MRRVWLLLALTACPKDDDAGGGGNTTTTHDAQVLPMGAYDAPPAGGGGTFCIYTEIRFTFCSGLPPDRDESTRCAAMASLPSCPPPPDEDRLVGDCLFTQATVFEAQRDGASCDAILEALRAEECARLGEGACDETECSDGRDNNHNGLADCDEPLCFAIASSEPPGLARCRRAETGPGRCMNLVDDDNDGDYDCADADCAALCAANEGLDADTCLDEGPDGGIDDDGDGLVNCDEPYCRDPRHGFLPCPTDFEDCGNDADDDGDLRIDCGDSDCSARCAAEEGLDDNSCSDGEDNDADGLIDCAEPDCVRSAWACTRPESCADGVDNDHDFAIDAEDEDCTR